MAADSNMSLADAVRSDPVAALVKLRDDGALTEEQAEELLRDLAQSRPDLVRERGLAERGFRALDGAMRLFANGMTLGTADLGAGVMDAVFGEGSVGENIAANEAQTDQLRAQSPAAGITADVSGGIATSALAAAAVPALAAAANPLARGLSLGQRALRAGTAAGLGGAAGAVSGAANARGGVENRVEGAIGGAAVGGVVGLAAPVVIAGLTQVGKPFANMLRNALSGPDSDAARRVLEAFENDAITLDQASARLRTLGSRAFMVDAGAENVAGLLRAAASQPGRGRRLTERLLNRRITGQSGPFTGGTQPGQFDVIAKQLMGDNSDAATTLAQLRSDRSQTAEGLYKQAFDGAEDIEVDVTGVMADIMADLQTMPATGTRAAALEKALGFITREGEFDGNTVRVPVTDLEMLHNAKREIDTMIQTRMAGDKSLDATIVRDLVQIKNELVDVLGEASPAYREAIDTYAGDSAYINAIEMGTQLFKRGADAITPEDVAKLSDSELVAFRLGAADAIIDRISSPKDAADVTRNIFGSPELRDLMTTAFAGDVRAFREFQATVLQEARFAATRNAASPSVGSRTSVLDAERASLAGADAVSPIIQAAAGDIGGAALNAAGGVVRGAVNNARLVKPKTAEDITRILTAGGDDAENLLQQLQVDQVLNGVGRNLNTLAAPLALGGVGGANASESAGPLTTNALLQMLQ